jgi:hypothetical protein
MRNNLERVRMILDQNASDAGAVLPGETLSAEELVRQYIQRREREWKRTKRRLGAATLVGVGALVVAGLVQVWSHSKSGKLDEGVASLSGRAFQAITALEGILTWQTRLTADPRSTVAGLPPASTGATVAPMPSSAPHPSALPESKPAPALLTPAASTVLAPGLAPPPITAGEPRKHSGVILDVSPGAQTITIEEIGPWTGSDSSPRTQTVRLTSRTGIILTSRSEAAPKAGGWPGGFRESATKAADLRPGDFVTVTETPLDNELVAESVAISRPASLDLPRPEEGPEGRPR